MKKLLTIVLMSVMTLSASAATPDKDTIEIAQSDIVRFVTDEVMTKSGNKGIKYYAIVRGELVPTTKTVMEKVALCKKFNAKCALAAVRNKRSKSLIKIILN